MTEEQIVIIVAETIERSMFAPHEFPLSLELHAKYLTTAREVVQELKFARPKLVAAGVDGVQAERARCAAIARAWIHGAPTTTTERVVEEIALAIEAAATDPVITYPTPAHGARGLADARKEARKLCM